MAHRLGNKNYRLPLSGYLLKRCRILFAAYMNWWNAKCQILPVGAYNIVLYFFICQISIHIAIISSSDIGPNMKNILGEYSLFFKASTWNYLHLNWICLFEPPGEMQIGSRNRKWHQIMLNWPGIVWLWVRVQILTKIFNL